MKKAIAIGLSPNAQKDDILLALRLLFSPWSYIHGKYPKLLEQWFENYFESKKAVTFQNARSAFYAILYGLHIGKGDEVILQAFTCVVVPDAIIATGAMPIYMDIDKTLNIDPTDIEKKITPRTKAIIVQHTFGIPANMEKVMDIAKRKNIYVIEDMAHSMGGEYKHQKLGTFGIASFFSFGKDKAFSSVAGGIAITSNTSLEKQLQIYQKERDYPSFLWIFWQLWYLPVCWFVIHFYYFLSLGKIVHFIFKKFNFFSFPINQSEKNGVFISNGIKKFPNALAALALQQVKKHDIYNKRRTEIGQFYKKELTNQENYFFFPTNIPLLRFPYWTSDKIVMKRYFANKGIYIGDWYTQVIDPVGVNFEKIYYKVGSCPKAEEAAKHMINLPTYPKLTDNDVKKITTVLKTYDKR